MKLKTLVYLDFNDRRCSFLLLGMPYRRRIVSSLGSKSNESRFVVVGLPSWINLDSVAPSRYKSRVSLSTGWVVDVVSYELVWLRT